MLIGVIGLTKGLLPSHIILTCEDALRPWSSVGRGEVAIIIIEHGATIVKPLLFLLGAFFKEYLAENILLLLVGVVILHIVIMWLVEHRVRVVVAVWILVADPASLTHRRVWVDTYPIGSPWHLTWLLAIASLACYKQDAFVETADHWNLWLSLLLCCCCCLSCCRLGLRLRQSH